MFDKLLKATVAVALTPVSLVVDLACLPSDAYDGENVAPRTRALLEAAGKNITAAVKPDADVEIK